MEILTVNIFVNDGSIEQLPLARSETFVDPRCCCSAIFLREHLFSCTPPCRTKTLSPCCLQMILKRPKLLTASPKFVLLLDVDLKTCPLAAKAEANVLQSSTTIAVH
uniref:Uncharacterized protein n=1 Tax=Ditylum brightwellii TaxID=49249 RepID=A0A7S2EW26_9STRA